MIPFRRVLAAAAFLSLPAGFFASGIGGDGFGFSPDSGDGIYLDTTSFDPDAGDGIYEDTTGMWSGDGGEAADGTDDPAFDADDPFASAEDVQGTESSPVTTNTAGTTEEKKIDFYGNFSTSMGLLSELYPTGIFTPFASFTNSLGFTAKPYSDITIRGQLYTDFPDMKVDISTLYFDYILDDKIYITAGKTSTAWGNSVIFDTNILDDNGDEPNPIFQEDDNKERARFDSIITVPLGRSQFQGIAMYEGTELNKENLSYAASFEVPVGPVAIKFFGRKWAENGSLKPLDPAVGAELTTDIFGNHITLWGKVHSKEPDIDKISLAKAVAGISRIIATNGYGKIGIAAEYQFTYDIKQKDKKQTELAFTVGWSHAMNTDFTPAVRWWMNWDGKKGYIIPSLTYTGFSHMNITMTVPYIFGGASYSVNGATYESTEEDPIVFVGLVFSLSVSY